MSSRKAVVITSENQQTLIYRYGADPDDLDQFPIGYALIANFGDNGDYRYEGVLDPENMAAIYVRGKDLKNGFFEITPKE